MNWGDLFKCVPVGNLLSITPSLLDPDAPDYSQLHIMTMSEEGKNRM